MNKAIFFLCIAALASCSSTPTQIQTVSDAAREGKGDIPSGVYNNKQNENLLVVSQSLKSKIEELKASNEKLDDAIHEQKLRQKTLAQESNVLDARAAQVAAKNAAQAAERNLASQRKTKVHRTVTTTEESDDAQ